MPHQEEGMSCPGSSMNFERDLGHGAVAGGPRRLMLGDLPNQKLPQGGWRD